MPREFVEYTNDLPIKVSMQNIKKVLFIGTMLWKLYMF